MCADLDKSLNEPFKLTDRRKALTAACALQQADDVLVVHYHTKGCRRCKLTRGLFATLANLDEAVSTISKSIVEKVLGEGLRHSSGQDVGGRLNVRIDHSSGQLPEGHERGGLLALKRGNLRFI